MAGHFVNRPLVLVAFTAARRHRNDVINPRCAGKTAHVADAGVTSEEPLVRRLQCSSSD
jgi:hypothetical protein